MKATAYPFKAAYNYLQEHIRITGKRPNVFYTLHRRGEVCECNEQYIPKKDECVIKQYKAKRRYRQMLHRIWDYTQDN
jgi:hypothetical protein